MPGRKYNSDKAIYGFNGMRMDNEMYGEGNAYDFGARIQDPRLGRWLSVDPLQKKYPSIIPYAFALNNPNFYYDVDGRDVGVSIVRNPQGGGTITFSTTTYVTGINAEQKVAAYNEAYKLFIKANPNMKSSDGKWNVEIKMNFVNANDIKHQVAEKQEMAAENYMNIKAPSEGESRARAGMPLPGSSDKGSIVDVDPAGNNGKGLRLGTFTASGRFAQMYTTDGGRTAVHEELHNWGIGDYYADVSYQWQMIDNKIGKVEQSGTTNGTSTSYVGFEGTIMSTGEGLSMPQVTVDDLINTAFKTSEVKKSDNFVMARKVDEARPNGSTNAGQVPQTKTEKTKTKTTTYSKPVYKSAGN